MKPETIVSVLDSSSVAKDVALRKGPFRNILVGIDFSDVSLRALTRALVLAQQSGGRLRLLHVLDGFPHETVYSGSRAFRVMDDFRARVAHVNRRLRSLIPTDALNWADIDAATVSGRAPDAIVAAASERGADLIVLGLPRRSRAKALVTGSTAHRVLRRTATPVLLVPGPATASVGTSTDEQDDHVARELPALGVFTSGGTASAAEGRSRSAHF